MANFGLVELRLVKPRDGWPSDKARAAASKADHVIDGAVVYDTLEEAIADLNFVYATTARGRDGFKPVRSPVTAAETLRHKFRRAKRPVYSLAGKIRLRRTKTSHWPTKSSLSRSILPLLRSTSHKRCC